MQARGVSTPIRDAEHSNECLKAASATSPILDAVTRERLGRQLQAMYEPVFDQMLDPRLAEMLRQLDRDREA